MSDDLLDEIEAINSIYGPETLIPSPDPSSPQTYILTLPNEASSLLLSFPATYPSKTPPEVIATHASNGKKGAGARDLGLFRDAVTTVFGEGMVCVFDAVEEFGRLREVVLEEEGDGEDGEEEEEEVVEEEEFVDLNSLPTPPWTISEPWVELKSTFIAHIAPVTSPDQAKLYLNQLLASDKRIANASHNISAWRIRSNTSSSSAGSAAVSFQDCDDDGETAAGGRLLHLMQLMDIWDAMVVVTRWYGGVHMGPRRFAVINGVAREGFVKAGLVKEEKKKGK